MIEYTVENLEGRTKAELQAICASLALDYPLRASKGDLVERIIAKSYAAQPDSKASAEPEEKPTIQPAERAEIDAIKQAISPYIARGMVATFTDDTWRFEYRGREDSGTLFMPVSVIERMAAQVSRGGFRMAEVEINGERMLQA